MERGNFDQVASRFEQVTAEGACPMCQGKLMFGGVELCDSAPKGFLGRFTCRDCGAEITITAT
jgi:rubredoxin